MHNDAPELSLVPVPELDLAQRVFVAATRCAGIAAAAAPLPIAGPGWFDSSWDLRRGLIVTETDDDGLLAWSMRMLLPQGAGGARSGASLSAT